MRVLVVGSGGREHALVSKLAQEAEVFAAPGNPGIAQEAQCFPVDPLSSAAVLDLARRVACDLVVVGPEAPLIRGLADALAGAGVPTYGPIAAAAQLEGSKAFSKALMTEVGVPTAAFEVFTDPRAAKEFARKLFDGPSGVVIKASGEALGKGVAVCDSLAEAEAAIDGMLVDRVFGEAGETIVVEERLPGPEFSLLTLCSGTDCFSLPVSQDYKRARTGGEGPNTGGMGSAAPVRFASPDLVARTEASVVRQVLERFARMGQEYRGTLYSGMMMRGDDALCLEYNVRFGDPETQSVLALVGDGFANALMQCAKGEPIDPPKILDRCAVTVVMASPGYPETSTKGIPIEIGAMPPGAKAFHAGTRLENGVLETAGGRVLGVTAVGQTIADARSLAYRGAAEIRFEGAQMRTDIGLGLD